MVLGTTSWSGEYSWNSAELDLTGTFASTTAGRYDDGTARPALSFDGDRQADDGEVFVHLDFDITEISTSGVAGINVNTFRIVADSVFKPRRRMSTCDDFNPTSAAASGVF